MKTGIMTFHASNNCGSLLQAYALQKTLNKLDKKNEIIDFSNNKQKEMYALFRKNNSIHNFKYNIATLLYYKYFKKHFYDYEQFRKNYLRLSDEKLSTIQDLEKISEKYEYLISGSDQVWNTKCTDADDAYFLNFSNTSKKIAYAPSFGCTNINDDLVNKEKYRKMLNEFKTLSCREKNGCQWIYELTNRSATLLIDPTLLLTSDEWDELLDCSDNKEGDYIFYYAYTYSNEVNELVKKLSIETNCKVYVIDAKNWVKTCKKYGFCLSENGGPLEFLRLIRNAKYVITTSFHGTVFSIIYNKKFAFINSKIHDVNDDRTATLLESVKMEQKYVDIKDFTMAKLEETIDFNKTEKIIENLQNEALNYINDCYKENNGNEYN